MENMPLTWQDELGEIMKALHDRAINYYWATKRLEALIEAEKLLSFDDGRQTALDEKESV
jgi:hypothetical protein